MPCMLSRVLVKDMDTHYRMVGPSHAPSHIPMCSSPRVQRMMTHRVPLAVLLQGVSLLLLRAAVDEAGVSGATQLLWRQRWSARDVACDPRLRPSCARRWQRPPRPASTRTTNHVSASCGRRRTMHRVTHHIPCSSAGRRASIGAGLLGILDGIRSSDLLYLRGSITATKEN